MELLEESFTLPPDSSGSAEGEGYPLYVTAKRYYAKEMQVGDDKGGLDLDFDTVTIIALHSTSFHKETWEPTLEALFESVSAAGAGRKGKVRIREVWAVDCPNHGYSGILNREMLKTAFVNNCGWPLIIVAVKDDTDIDLRIYS
jgi:hypothetical protein